MRRDYYVYFHRDSAGKVFYVGKGTERRAWSTCRHPAWHKYVAERLNGEYTVEIHRDGLADEEAEALEEQLIAELGEHLVNWVNPGRQFDYDAIAAFHDQRNANRQFVAETKQFESNDLAQAVDRYRIALDCMRSYEALTLERGLIAELDVGPNWGDPSILNRLTVCLQKLGRHDEVVSEVERYFSEFPSVRDMAVGKQLAARAEKSRLKVRGSDA